MNDRFPRARKRFGQHFLEPAWVARLVEAAGPDPADTFLEIGPGRGALTRALAPRVRRLVCVEIDRDLAAALASWAPPHVEVVQADVLTVDLAALVAGAAGDGPLPDPPRAIRVIGNLPYNVASPILFQLMAAAREGRLLRDATLMLQKEVADRLVASPATPAYGALTIQVARLADVHALFSLPPGAFRPPPKVTSTVVHMGFRPPREDVGDAHVFEQIVRGVFRQRRKTIANALKPVADALGADASTLIERAGIGPRRRPEALTVGDYARLSRAVL